MVPWIKVRIMFFSSLFCEFSWNKSFPEVGNGEPTWPLVLSTPKPKPSPTKISASLQHVAYYSWDRSVGQCRTLSWVWSNRSATKILVICPQESEATGMTSASSECWEEELAIVCCPLYPNIRRFLEGLMSLDIISHSVSLSCRCTGWVISHEAQGKNSHSSLTCTQPFAALPC